jgi:hypothetical protein
MQKFNLSKLFSDIRTYFVLFVIILFSLGFLYRRVQEGYQIVEVLETTTEPAIELKVTKLQLDRADIDVEDSYQKNYNQNDYNDGDITGDLYYDYYFSDGSSTYERVSLSKVFTHNMPGIGSTARRDTFTRGKYRTKNGQVNETVSSEPLKIGDSINQPFNHSYTWTDITPHGDDIGALIYAEQRVSNGKVSTHQTVSTYIVIQP